MISVVLFIFSLACVLFAAMSNAAMDTLAHHYSISIFSDYGNDQYYNPEISWKNKYVDGDPKKGLKKIHLFGIFLFKKPVKFSDAWHEFKYDMLQFLAFGVIFMFESGIFLSQSVSSERIVKIACGLSLPVFLIFAVVWNLSFNYFYNKRFIK